MYKRQANTFSASNVFRFGGHQVNLDQDWYAITVPAGMSLRAEIIEGGAETCDGLNVDSRLTLYTSGGVLLSDDDDSGRGSCSRIDGTGTIPVNPSAHALAAGVYYLQVRASALASLGFEGQFDYRLAVTLRAP